MWELISRKAPYRDSVIFPTDEVIKGRRPTIPTHCPTFYSRLIEQCWNTEPSERADFDTLVIQLSDELSKLSTDFIISVEK
jgi:hypothetical protein